MNDRNLPITLIHPVKSVHRIASTLVTLQSSFRVRLQESMIGELRLQIHVTVVLTQKRLYRDTMRTRLY